MSSKSEIRREEYPLPESTEAISALVSQVLSQPGVVHKIIISAEHPVYVYREVEIGEFSEPGVNLDGALRHAEILEYVGRDEGNAFEALFDMLHLVEQEGMHPVCWATGESQDDVLESWLEMEKRGLPVTRHRRQGLSSLVGIEVRRLRSLPEDTLILCAAKFAEGDDQDVTLAVKTAIELRRDHDDISSDAALGAGGLGAPERAPAAPQVEAGGRGSLVGSWAPAGFLKDRIGS